MNTRISDMEHFLTIKDVMKITNLSRQQLWRLQRLGLFPQSCKLGVRRVGFAKSEVEAWIKARIQERDEQVQARKEALSG